MSSVFEHTNTEDVRFDWGKLDNITFTSHLNVAYEKIVHWKKNLFLLPTDKAGKHFIEGIEHLLNSWINESTIIKISPLK